MPEAKARSNRIDVRNPLLSLPSAEKIQSLSPECRAALRSLLGEIAVDSAIRAEKCWRKSKGPMAAYWKAVSVYAKHARKLCTDRRTITQTPRGGSQAVSDWISVKERLPRTGEACWIVCAGVVQLIAYMRTGMGFACSEGYCWHSAVDVGADSIPDEEVTHWMPLPEPPK